jgi:hypothetical protein
LLGLKEELRASVEMQFPDSVAKAATLAAMQEKLLEKSQKRHPKQYATKQTTIPTKLEGKSNFSPSDMWKAKQLREHIWANRLCFKCGDKFTPGHKCPIFPMEGTTTQLDAMGTKSSDGGGILSNYLLDDMELHALTAEEDCHISLDAISGTQSTKGIHLRELVRNQVLSILVDSGSSISFLNASMISRIQCQVLPVKPMVVEVANGQKVISDMVVPNFDCWLQGHKFSIDARVLDLATYDLILGMD